MTIEKLKGVITHATADSQERAGMLCQCCVCGKTATCKPTWDFYGDPGDRLTCEGCFNSGHRARGIEITTRNELMAIIAENTRAACAQIAARIMGRETGKAMKDSRRGPAAEVAEEIRNALLMWPAQVDAWGRKIEVEPEGEESPPALFPK